MTLKAEVVAAVLKALPALHRATFRALVNAQAQDSYGYRDLGEAVADSQGPKSGSRQDQDLADLGKSRADQLRKKLPGILIDGRRWNSDAVTATSRR